MFSWFTALDKREGEPFGLASMVGHWMLWTPSCMRCRFLR
jgi:hypothetical protein